MEMKTYPIPLPRRFAVSLIAEARFRYMMRALLISISIYGLTIASGRAEVSMTFDGYDLSYASGSFKMSETYGQQFIDIEDVVIRSEQGEAFTADRLMLNATGTMQSLDWIEKAEFINAALISTSPTGQSYELRSERFQAENIHLDQPGSLNKLAERLHQDRARPSYLKLTKVFLTIPDEGFLLEIEEFVADGNPDLMNNQLPKGQHISEVTLKAARLMPSGSGEASFMFRLMLSGLGLEALQIDVQASALSRFTPGQFGGEFRLELDADNLVGVDLDVDTGIDAERYQKLLQIEEGITSENLPEQQVALGTSLFKSISLSVRDSGALYIYDSLSSSFGLPDRRQLALMTEYEIYDQLSQSAGLLAAPIADFIRAGGRLNLFAEPRALTADDLLVDEDALLQNLVDKARLRLTHTP